MEYKPKTWAISVPQAPLPAASRMVRARWYQVVFPARVQRSSLVRSVAVGRRTGKQFWVATVDIMAVESVCPPEPDGLTPWHLWYQVIPKVFQADTFSPCVQNQLP